MQLQHKMMIQDLREPGHIAPRGYRSSCPKNEDFLIELQKRHRRWSSLKYVKRKSLWQAAIDDKLIGYMYARSIGVHTPSVLWCNAGGLSALPMKWPKRWGCCFAIKPLHGYNDIGVMLIDHGVEQFSGWPLRGRSDVLKLVRYKGWSYKKLMSRSFYVETLVQGEAQAADRAGRNKTTAPTDWKFMVFGEQVGSVAIIMSKKTTEACMAWFDENYTRHDVHGCACYNLTTAHGCAYRHCPLGTPAKPRLWDEMVQTARRIGGQLGMHMRVDMYASSEGVMLGEFTPWHANGKAHCVVRPGFVNRTISTNRTRAAWTHSGRNDRVVAPPDMCQLGRLWNSFRRGTLSEGGPYLSAARRTPTAITGWEQLLSNDSQKCKAAVRSVQPVAVEPYTAGFHWKAVRQGNRGDVKGEATASDGPRGGVAEPGGQRAGGVAKEGGVAKAHSAKGGDKAQRRSIWH
jgi:hypothetical protein